MAKKKPDTGEKTAKHAGGRPTVITEGVVRKLEEAFARSCTDTEACLYADISRTAFYEWLRKNEEFANRKEVLRHKPTLNARFNVTDAIAKWDKDSSEWWLERKGRDEFSTASKVALSGEIGYRSLKEVPTSELDKLAQ